MTVLIVDDQADFRGFARRVLETDGYRIHIPCSAPNRRSLCSRLGTSASVLPPTHGRGEAQALRWPTTPSRSHRGTARRHRRDGPELPVRLVPRYLWLMRQPRAEVELDRELVVLAVETRTLGRVPMGGRSSPRAEAKRYRAAWERATAPSPCGRNLVPRRRCGARALRATPPAPPRESGGSGPAAPCGIRPARACAHTQSFVTPRRSATSSTVRRRVTEVEPLDALAGNFRSAGRAWGREIGTQLAPGVPRRLRPVKHESRHGERTASDSGGAIRGSDARIVQGFRLQRAGSRASCRRLLRFGHRDSETIARPALRVVASKRERHLRASLDGRVTPRLRAGPLVGVWSRRPGGVDLSEQPHLAGDGE